jgi:hypothetical protein
VSAGLLCCAAAFAHAPPDWSLQAQQGLRGAGPVELEQRERLLRQGEAALAAGDAGTAQQVFDQAALMSHAADTEVALVRTYMQLGEYRRALAFCAHVTGAHGEVVAAAALYGWLLHIGGQAAYAALRLDEAARLFPGEPLLDEVRREVAGPWPRAGARLRMLPARLAPYAPVPALPEGARVVGSATLLADGRAALAPAPALQQASAVWLRNGLGQTVAARPLRVDAALGLVLLEADAPLPVAGGAAAAERDPFAGRPGYAVEFAASDDAQPAWPLLRSGFLGAVGHDPARRTLGLDVPPGPRGGPVFDAGGRLVGVAVAGSQRDGMVPVSALRAAFGDRIGRAAADAPPRVAPDEVYEHGLKHALQLIVVR